MTIKDLIKNRSIIHCRTEENALDLLLFLHINGYKWFSGLSFIERTNYGIYKEETCYVIYDCTYTDLTTCINKGLKVINFDELNLMNMMEN